MLTNNSLTHIDYLAGYFLRSAEQCREVGDNAAAVLFDQLADHALAAIEADGAL